MAALGSPPQYFSSSNGTLGGSIDGTNKVFVLPCYCQRARVFKNGLLQTLGQDCVFSGFSLMFDQPPSLGDQLLIEGWLP